jgi:hypothetical protein
MGPGREIEIAHHQRRELDVGQQKSQHLPIPEPTAAFPIGLAALARRETGPFGEVACFSSEELAPGIVRCIFHGSTSIDCAALVGG